MGIIRYIPFQVLSRPTREFTGVVNRNNSETYQLFLGEFPLTVLQDTQVKVCAVYGEENIEVCAFGEIW